MSTQSDQPVVPLLQCRGISKRFGGEVALEGVDFTLEAGRVHGLVGSNGAGKSTLMKILAGVLPDHDGEILLEGRPIRLSSPQAALAHGIAMVYQELSGIAQLSVAENLFLGRQPTTKLGRIDWRSMYRQAQQYLEELEIHIDVRQRLDRYPLVIRQMVEIARGLHSGARVLILDEPTSALSPPETQRLFSLVARLKRLGVSFVFISHFIEDVLAICDDVTILRDGRRIETTPSTQLDKHYVIRTMLGHGLEGSEAGYETSVALPPRSAAPPLVEVSHLRLAGAFGEVNFSVAPGECLGIYGFVGAGHQEVVQTLAGARRATAGTISLAGRALRAGSVRAAVERGVLFVGADRKQTLVLNAPIYQNATLAHLRRAVGRWLTRRRETNVARPLLERVGCQPPDPHLKAGSLSGGNQQKVVFAKWLLGPIRVLLLDEPTRGMDVGAKEDIMRLVAELKQQGAAIVLASNEPELILAHADRILVMNRGWITHQFAGVEVDKAELMRSA
ncbi:MAG: sugar ABC transporter ATP-binding protein [Pirellulales bacterium]|nr:sugar ABC transporter ATP-binding protein [Pirellulales bacterium]